MQSSRMPLKKKAKLGKGNLCAYCLLIIFIFQCIILLYLRPSQRVHRKHRKTGVWSDDGDFSERNAEILNSEHFFEGWTHRLKEQRPISPYQSEVNIAYFIQVTGKTLNRLPALLRRIHHPENTYLIHLDQKGTQNAFRKVSDEIQLYEEFGNVYLMPRESIVYKGVSMLVNTISAISYLLELDAEWDYFINLSGSCYPLVASDEQRRLLAMSRSKALFMSLSELMKGYVSNRMKILHFDPGVFFRRNYLHDRRLAQITHHLHMFRRRPFRFKMRKAEAWVIISREFAEYAVGAPFPRKLLLYCVNAAISDEHFFPTIALEEPYFASRVSMDGFRTVIWNLGDKIEGTHPHDLDLIPPNREEFAKDVLRSTRSFFVRKLSSSTSTWAEHFDQFYLGLNSSIGQKESSEYLYNTKLKLAEELRLVEQQISAGRGPSIPRNFTYLGHK